MHRNEKTIAIYFEHPEWFRPLFAEFDRRGTAYVKIDAVSHSYDVSAPGNDYALLFNRMSASAYLREHTQGIFFTRNFLEHLETSGTRVINGSVAFGYEISKAAQLTLLRSLGVLFPRSRVVNSPDQLARNANDIGFPIIIKPNIGGRGAGIIRINSARELNQAIEGGQIGLGIDHTALVQEFISPRDGHITRVETLGGKFLYAIKVSANGENFNLCPAEICDLGRTAENAACLADGPKAGLKIEPYQPPPEVVSTVERIVACAEMDVGGIEYIIDARDGRLLYYDINALSNFVADAPGILGFDPHARLVDYLERERDIS